jgi:predicted alpha/beta superfamily hydrolase
MAVESAVALTQRTGSSLGGLVSCYTGWTRSNVWSKAGCMSSSFWSELSFQITQALRGEREVKERLIMAGGILRTSTTLYL